MIGYKIAVFTGETVHTIVGTAVVFHTGHRAALAVLLYLMPDSVAPNRHTCNTHGHQSNKNDKRYFAGFDSGFHRPLPYHRDLQFNIYLYSPVYFQQCYAVCEFIPISYVKCIDNLAKYV